MSKKTYFLILLLSCSFASYAQQYKLIVGTYTKGASEGIYVYDFNSKTADVKQVNIIKNVANPSYVTLSKNKKFLYSVFEDGKNSAASAFKFNNLSGDASFLNKAATQGANPCYILTDDKNLFTANYSGGNISVFGIKADGSLDNVKQVVQHTGKDPDIRQKNAHVHQVMFSPDRKYLLAVDLGEDAIFVYKYNAAAEHPLSLHKTLKTNTGTGPRHLTFSPNGKFVYLTHEFNGMISAYYYQNGNLELQQEVATTPNDFSGKIDAADIHISTDGKFLYQTNRGDANTINVFAVQKNGNLKFVESTSTLGKGPRNFAIDPSGKFLLIAHQYTNNIVIFNRNAKTGKLTYADKEINLGSPVCLVFNK